MYLHVEIKIYFIFQWPVIGWEAESGISHFAEGKIHGTAASIEWAKSMGELDGNILKNTFDNYS